MSMYNLIEYRDNYSKTGSLWKCYRDEPALDNNVANIDFPADNNNSSSFKFFKEIAGRTGNYATKNVKIKVPLKYLKKRKMWRKHKISLINCEISVILTRSANYFIIANPGKNQIPTFELTDIKCYVLVVTLSTQDNEKRLQ